MTTMWKCPKCGRSFRNQNQHHFCGSAPSTIDDYISEQGDDISPLLLKVINAMREVLPDAREKIAWQMPTFWQGRNIIHFAAHKGHLGIYPGEKTVAELKGDIERLGLKSSKGSIQMPYSMIDAELLDFIKIVTASAQSYNAR